MRDDDVGHLADDAVRPGPGDGGSGGEGDGGHAPTPTVGAGRRFLERVLDVRLGRVPGQGEEHVVEGGLVHLDVVDGDAGAVEGPDDGGGQARAAADRRPQPPAVMAHVDRTGHEGRQRHGRVVRRHAEGDLEAGPAGAGLELPRRPVGDDPAVVDDHDAVGQLVGLVEVLGGEEQGHAAGHQLADDVPHADPAGGVEPGGRLVEEEHRRSGHEPGRQVETPPHAAGVTRQDAVGRIGQVELLEEFGGPSLGVRPAQAAQLSDHDEVLAAGQQAVHRGVLGGHPDAALHGRRLAHHVVTGDPGPAGVGHGQGGEDADGGGLAGAVGPEHGQDRPGRDVEVHPVQGERRAEPLGQPLRPDGGLIRHDVSLPVGQQVLLLAAW